MKVPEVATRDSVSKLGLVCSRYFCSLRQVILHDNPRHLPCILLGDTGHAEILFLSLSLLSFVEFVIFQIKSYMLPTDRHPVSSISSQNLYVNVIPEILRDSSKWYIECSMCSKSFSLNYTCHKIYRRTWISICTSQLNHTQNNISILSGEATSTSSPSF